MKNMCASAGISILFNQVRYEHPHHKIANAFLSIRYFFFCKNVRGFEQGV